MTALFQMVGISKQAFWKYQNRKEVTLLKVKASIAIIRQIRKRHKRMGCRSIYFASPTPPPVGRDAFIEIGMANGFRLKRRRNKKKTTWSQRVEIFPNLIEGMKVTGINQVWQSDIFYHQEDQKDYYGITIIDVYSRQLVALHLSRSLRAEENVKALQQAIDYRAGHNLVNCVFHSDHGTQYISEIHKGLLREYKMRPSMGKLPQENAYAEKVQDIIKNYYLVDAVLEGRNLKSVSRQIKDLYNKEKPHTSLKMMTPIKFERHVEKLSIEDRPNEFIFKWDHQLSTKNELLTKEKSSKKENL